MKDKEKKEKLDYGNLNALIQTSRVILKIGLILAICGLVVFGFVILEKTQILSIIGTILSLIMPLFIGFAVAWLFEPLIKYFESKSVSRKLSTIIVYILFILVLIILLGLVVPEFISQLKELISQVPLFLNDAKSFITNLFSKFADSEIDVATLQNDLIRQLESFLNNFTSNSVSSIVNGVTNVLSEGFKVILGLIIGFYISLDFDKVVGHIVDYIPKRHKKDLSKVLDELNIMARNYVSGTLFTSLIVAFLVFLGLIISGISSPLLFAVFCGITNIIPYFGPYIGGIPVIIVGFSISPMCGIISAIVIFVVQFVEGNIIHPLIIGKATSIHPITIVISLLIFEYFFGIGGMILATPIVGALKIIFNHFDSKYDLLDRIKPVKNEN